LPDLQGFCTVGEVFGFWLCVHFASTSSASGPDLPLGGHPSTVRLRRPVGGLCCRAICDFCWVELDLSKLDFVDLTGARAVARALAAASPDHMLSLEPAPSEQARRLFDLVDLRRLVACA
jgi:hypothetical protein